MHEAPRVRHDAIVIGGGPAGSVAALLLRRRGWSVALIERRPRGRDKCCGHCLGVRALTLLRRLEIEDVVGSARYGSVDELDVLLPRARTLVVDVRRADPRTGVDPPTDASGWLVDRRRMDAALLDAAAAAGVEVHLGVGASLHRDQRGVPLVRLQTTAGSDRPLVVSAPLIVGADGLGSAVARAIAGAPIARDRRGYGFSADLEDAGDIDAPRPGTVAMHVGRDGYLGVVRGADHRLHVAGLVRGTASRGRSDASGRDPVSFVGRLAREHPALESVARAIGTAGVVAAGPMPWRPRAPGRLLPHDESATTLALVGDAAGYVEPFTGEGMTWAFESAVLLAASAPSPGVFHLDEYQRTWRRTIGRTQRRCGVLTAVLRRPLLLGVAARVLPAASTTVAAAASAPRDPAAAVGPSASLLSGLARRIVERTVLR